MKKNIEIGVNDLVTTHPELAKEWHPTKNKGLTPQKVSAGSGRKVWWQCKEGHEWETRIYSRSSGALCPYCSGLKAISGVDDLATLYPHLAKEWHPTKNKGLTPHEIKPKSHKKVWWLGKCGHEWDARVGSRTEGANCPVCSGKRILSGFNDLATLYPDLAKEWHPTKNETLVLEKIGKSCRKLAWWKCSTCQHEWEKMPYLRTLGSDCPKCHPKAS